MRPCPVLCPVMLLLCNTPGASIAIDDCYELWESGFVSIPYDFELRDLQPQLQKLLAGSSHQRARRGAAESGPAQTSIQMLKHQSQN